MQTRIPMKKIFLTLTLILVAILSGTAQNHWEPNPYLYPSNMNVIGVIEINGFEQRNEFLELGVFCDEECRGSMILDYVAQLDRYFLYLTIYGVNGDDFEFFLYDHLTGQELEVECENEMVYHSNSILGTVTDPYVFVFNGGQCQVNVVADPPEGGTVTGGGTVAMGSSCAIMATPVEGGSFIAWELNGDFLTTEDHYTFNAVADIDFVALFGNPYFQVTVDASPSDGGMVTGGGEYLVGETCTVTATPHQGYAFDFWKCDGEVVSYDESYSFVVHEDIHLTAFFHFITYQVTVLVEPVEGGVITGAGEYPEGEVCELMATPNEGFLFLCWMENGVLVSTSPAISFMVLADRTLTASFSLIPNNYLISVTANPPEGGTVTGGGAYQEGSVCSLTATPATNYVFDRWTENGMLITTLPTYTFVVSQNRTLVAEFHNVVGVQEEHASCQLYPNPAHHWLRVTDSEKLFVVTDLQGHVVLMTRDNPLDISQLAPGIYCVNGKTFIKY